MTHEEKKLSKLIVIALMWTTLIFSNLSAQESQTIYKDFCNANYKQIRYGQRSEAIRDLQKILNIENSTQNTVTNYFGPTTRKQVTLLQGNNNLPKTGTVGPMTSALLKNKYCQGSEAQSNILKTNIPINEIAEVKNGYIVKEQKSSEVNNIDEGKFKILVFDGTIANDFPGSFGTWFEWKATSTDGCQIYHVEDETISPPKRNLVFDRLPSSGSTSTNFVMSKVNSPKPQSVYQLDCRNDKQKLIIRTGVYFEW